MKCPLCDGTVVNGRCRDCGMPYRNDEILYHLNEDRRTHEQHATGRAKEELLKRMVPPGDTVKQTSGRTAQKNMQKKSGKAVQKSVPRTAAKNVKEKQKAAARNKKEFGRSSNSSWSSEKKSRKKRSPGGIIFWIIVILMIAGPVIEDFVTRQRAERAYNEYLESVSFSDSLIENEEDMGEADIQETDTYGFSSWSDSEGRMEYGLNIGYGSIEVGEELPAGDYRIYTNNDEVQLLCKKAGEKKAEVFELKKGDDLELLLGKGDVLKLDGNDDSYNSVYFKELDR